MNNLKKICLVAFSSTLILIPNNYANAKTYSESTDGGVHILALEILNTSICNKKINVNEISKNKYAAITFQITKSQSITFGEDILIKDEYKKALDKIQNKIGVFIKKTVQIHAGTTLTVEKSAPKGVYGLYECQECKNGIMKFYNNEGGGTKLMLNRNLENMPTIKKAYIKAIRK